MYTVLGCLFQQHDLILVAAAAAMCIFACGTAQAMTLRARTYQGRAQLLWLLGAGSVAGAGIWATHFVAMLAYQPGLPMRYDVALTILSAMIAIAIPALGSVISVTRAGGALGGMVFGAGVLSMHYVGMAALQMPAVIVWNSGMVAGSVIVGVSLGGMAGHVAMLPASWVHSVSSAGLRIAAIIGAHFTAMASLTAIPMNQSLPQGGASFSPAIIAFLVMVMAAFVVGQALIVAMVDRHLKSKSERAAVQMRAYIAELEETKNSLEKASSAAEVASKSKSAFLASMSHELRTPLNAILGFSETMMSEALGPLGTPRYKDYLTDVHNSGRHLLELINDILDIARLDAGQAELDETIFSPAEKIQDVVRMMSAQALKAKVTLVADLPPNLPLLTADRRRVRQILLHLVSNALKFTGPGGTVTVRAWADDTFMFQVSDTGIGMSRQDFSKAMEPFGQIDSSLARKYEGTGLGLPLTRQLTELHGGTLALESELGTGTTVTVTLPKWRMAQMETGKAA
jgi:signal transduction histidine kinase